MHAPRTPTHDLSRVLELLALGLAVLVAVSLIVRPELRPKTPDTMLSCLSQGQSPSTVFSETRATDDPVAILRDMRLHD